MIKEIKEIREKALHLTLGDFVEYLQTMAANYRVEVVVEMLQGILGDYQRIKQYYSMGVDDKMRDELYDRLFKRTWIISNHLMHYALLQENTTYKQAYQQAMHLTDVCQIGPRLVSLEQEITMASLEGDDAKTKIDTLLDEQYKYRQQTFCAVYTSGPLTHGEADAIRDAVLSPELSTIDRQMLTSALLLAQQSVFDLEKFRILTDIVVQSTDQYARERALVAVALALPEETEKQLFEEELDNSFSLMMAMPGVEKELAELQVQLMATLDTKSSNKKMKDDILSVIMKSRFANPLIKPTEEDKLNDMLHPELEEQEMEKLEGYSQEVRRLLRNGKDLFYDLFSQTKRFPMFYTLVNWFIPFYEDHPVLRGKINLSQKAVRQMLSSNSFCDSDMYSYALAFSSSYNMLPEELRSLIRQGEMLNDLDGLAKKDSTNIRKNYLQQLYRFYNLWMQKDDFQNPFRSIESMFFMNDDMVSEVMHNSRYAYHIALELKKRGYTKVLKTMFQEYANWLSPDWLLLSSENAEKEHDYLTAMMMLTVAEAIRQKDKNIKLRRIELQLKHGIMPPQDKTLEKMIAEAEEGDDVEKMKWLLARTYMIKGKAEMSNGNDDVDDALDDEEDELEKIAKENEPKEEGSLEKAEKLLVEVIQMNPGNMDYVVELLDCCLMERRLEAIPNILKQVDKERLTSLCYLKMGLALIILGRIPEAIDALTEVCRKDNITEPAAVRTQLRNSLQSQRAFLPEVEDAFNSIEIVIDLTAEKIKG